MAIDILMPSLSPTMERGNLTRWLRSVGDQVAAGDILAEIETDKATMEVEAAADGILARIHIPAGTIDIPVNTAIGSIGSKGDMAAETLLSAAGYSTSNGTSAPTGRTPDYDSGPRRIFASPIARRLMAEAGLDPETMAGSGPRGRILERDVVAATEARKAATRAKVESVVAQLPEVHVAPAEVAPSDDDRIRTLFAQGSYSEVEHDAMRITIARRLTESKQTVPHFYLSSDCDIGALLLLRQQLNDAAGVDADGKPIYRLSVNDFVVKALALALARVPDANVSFTRTSMIRHHHADIGVAVAIPGGLMTPIVRRAEAKTLSTISNEIKALAVRARERRLKPDEYQGGTSSVSNLGMHGVRDFGAIINRPQSSILAVGAGEQRPVVRDGKIEVATMMSVTLSVDHRAVDGAVGAELLAAFKALIEQPMTMLV